MIGKSIMLFAWKMELWILTTNAGQKFAYGIRLCLRLLCDRVCCLFSPEPTDK